MSFDQDNCSLAFLFRDNQVWWHAGTNMVICPFLRRLQSHLTETIAFSLCHPETIKSDGSQRQIWWSAPFLEDSNVFLSRLLQSPFVIRRQSSLMARRDKYGHFPFLSKTQMSFDQDYCSLPLSSRDNQVRWHVETNMVIFPFCRRLRCFFIETIAVFLCHPKTIKSDSTQRQIWSFALFVEESNGLRPRLLQSPFVI